MFQYEYVLTNHSKQVTLVLHESKHVSPIVVYPLFLHFYKMV